MSGYDMSKKPQAKVDAGKCEKITNFSEGYAIAAVKGERDTWVVINEKGEVTQKLKRGVSLESVLNSSNLPGFFEIENAQFTPFNKGVSFATIDRIKRANPKSFMDDEYSREHAMITKSGYVVNLGKDGLSSDLCKVAQEVFDDPAKFLKVDKKLLQDPEVIKAFVDIAQHGLEQALSEYDKSGQSNESNYAKSIAVIEKLATKIREKFNKMYGKTAEGKREKVSEAVGSIFEDQQFGG